MDSTIDDNKINGKAIADLYAKYVQVTLADFRQKLEETGFPVRQPTIVSFANENDPASVKYTQMKQDKAEELGIKFNIVYITPETPFEDAKQKVLQFNDAGAIDGIMVQMPITENLQNFKDNLVDLIAPEKDVDGLTEEGRRIYVPATVEAVLQILETRNTSIAGKVVAVVGSEGEIGQPLCEQLLKLEPAKLIKVDTKLPGTDISRDLVTADFVFSCTGVQNLVKAEHLKTGVIVYDIGLGDVDPSVYEIAAEYTPKFGGVGPNTVVALMRNVLKSYISRMSKAYSL